MFAWLRNRRRRKIAARPFFKERLRILEDKVFFYSLLNEDEKRRLRELIQIFIDEKRIEAMDGLEMTDEIKVLIAAHACRMVLALSFDFFKEAQTVLVYPSGMLRPPLLLGDRYAHGELAFKEAPLSGEAVHGGPVLLAWDAIEGGEVSSREGLNVILHEFAHKIDMLTGEADGVPPLKRRSDYKTWVEVCGLEYRHLIRRAQRGLDSFLDDYAAEHPAEFFAVATEYFFEKSREMKRRRPALYAVFAAFYKQDPAEKG